MAKIDISNKDAIKNINEIIDSFNKMRTALTGVGDGSKASFRKMSTGLSNLKQLNQQVISQLGVLSNAYKNVSKSQKSFVTQTRNLKQELAKTNIALSKFSSPEALASAPAMATALSRNRLSIGPSTT